MKKTILPILLAALSTTAAIAQTEKGHFMVGGGIADLSASLQKDEDATFSFSISPRAGYFVKNNWAIGSAVEFGMFKSGPATVLHYGVEPFTRYYFGSKKTRLFAEASAGVFGYHFNDHDPAFPGSGTGFTFAAGPGLTHFINEHVGLEASLMFRGTAMPHSSEMQYNPSLSVGFQIYLRGKHRTTKEPRFIETLPQEDKDE